MSTAGRTLDHAAGLYDCLSPLMLLGQEGRLNSSVRNSLCVGAGAKILDVGCATGRLTEGIAKSCVDDGGQVWGVDAAARMIALAEGRSLMQSNLFFKTALAEDLPFEDNTFDAIVSSLFFHHVNNDLKCRCLAEMCRTIKPGGRVIIMDVDVPTTFLGRICAWSGYFLFQQEEIKENILGVLRDAMDSSEFSNWTQVAHQLGYISTFVLTIE